MEDLNQSNYSLSASQSEEEAPEDFTNPLPRAVLRMNTHVLLDGEWSFAHDVEDKGLEEEWALEHTYAHKAQWPGSVEAHLAEVRGQHEGATWHDKIVVWYEREFTLPEIAEPQPRSLIQLTFGACGYETRVWLNGQPLKTIEGEEVHYGEYTSFSYELDAENLHLVNRLTVRIVDTMDAETPRGKQESHVYKRGGIWYQTYTGAVRSVWLETVERNRLRSRVGVVSVVEDQLVRFNLTLRIHDAGNYTIRLQVFDPTTTDRTTPLAESDFPLHLEPGQWQQRVVLEVPGAELWSPEAPNRYRLVAQLIDHEGYAAPIETLFGLRKIESRGRYVYLNNQPTYLDGILYQPGTATLDEMQRHMHAMKALGCNLVRVHIAGVDPRIYNLADELGLLLWVEVPSPHSSTARSRENHRAELLRLVTLSETHPSIVIWSLYNEDWGAQDIATNPATRQYIVEMYHFMQIAYPQFLVVDNDGWHHVSYTGRLKSDLLTAHLYTPDLERWKELLDRLVGGEMEGTAAFPLVVGDPFFYRRQVPLIVSEWGGFGFSDYGGPADAEARTNSIRAFKQELRQRPIAGDVYTQATNIEDERNGLIDPHTGALSVPAGLLASRLMERLD
ncbi:glycoside hydrolase family 2 TIM barrel-domain containing protein [Hymenobacter convexus]|uniref:glycoside hydrolase family 2 TIM barrel-domain containing protein n=1 Tax=Hymenobacter sp. CA1UV-4 TaxID=3063782 RepID=UPI0027128141|nr:glycoside hydrolase family 2 TIM barrel-domain containing protein [Hymenobacter sp. CA1UV-4]MDO7852349.1 glycoside hydrolase family 2 TIM barrel-domain containing protein [Hymenobacter sp. CA1UV-4]